MLKAHFYDNSLAGVCDAVGGIATFRRISERFHQKIEADPLLRDLFPKDMSALEERIALFLAERTGGLPEYTCSRGKNSLICRHAHLAIGQAEAAHWLEHMRESLAEEGVHPDVATRLLNNLTNVADTLVDPLVFYYSMPLAELRQKLMEDPGIALINEHGRNLLCAAAIGWDASRMRLLLEFGADIDTRDGGGHNALYRVSNGQGIDEQGRAALELLFTFGVNVNQTTGVGGMTPLHMSARRGTVQIGELLLDAGANVEATDKNGETPLRRAVNCGHEGMVQLLLSRGANPLTADNKGRTPIDAARTERIRQLLVRQI